MMYNATAPGCFFARLVIIFLIPYKCSVLLGWFYRGHVRTFSTFAGSRLPPPVSPSFLLRAFRSKKLLKVGDVVVAETPTTSTFSFLQSQT